MIFGRRAAGAGTRTRREGCGERMDVAYPAAELGRRGEDVAAAFVCRKGWRILERNWRYRHLELDMVALDGLELVFVEVKTRTGDRYGAGREAVNAGRQERYRAGAVLYLKRNGLVGCPVRFDVIEITDGRVVHLENAF